MIRHVVLYTYQDGIDDEVITKIYAELEQISGRLAGRLSYTWGKYDSYEG